MNAEKACEAAELIADSISHKPLWENWYIKEKIGSGTFCNVYLIEAKRISRTDVAALKIEPILAEERYCDNEERKRSYIEKRKQSVVNEAEIMYKLKDCPNIVGYQEENIREFYWNGKFEGYYFLIRMELLENVHKLIKKKQFDLSENNIRKLAKDIGNGIKAAHDMNIIHRDIKPENLFMSENGVYKLGDFNISKNAVITRTIAGTPPYMAPEVEKGFDYNKQADICSFGICLYQMMNDYYLPFEEDFFDEEAVIQRMSGVPLKPPKNASAEFSRVILKACAFNPNDRYHSIDEMLYDLENLNHAPISNPTPIGGGTQYADNEYQPYPNPNPYPVPPVPPIPSVPPTPEPKSNKTLILIIFIVSVMLITVGVSAFILFGKSDDDSDNNSKSDRNRSAKYSESSAYDDEESEEISDDYETEKEENNDYSESSDTYDSNRDNNQSENNITIQEIQTDAPHETEKITEAETGDYPPSFNYFSSTSELPVVTNNDGTFYYNVSNVVDGDYSTCWAEGTSDAGINESILLSSDRKQHVSEIVITNGYYKDKDIFYKNNRIKNCRLEFSDGTSQEVVLLGEYSEQSNLIAFDPPIDTEYIRITILSVYPGNKYNDTCISEISVK
ncbi:MAG: protein kinase [Ruminococcus sp.]|nr:protein kinase [Ruminococcus sp.]